MSNRPIQLGLCRLALQVVRRFAAQTPACPDGFLQIVYGRFAIRYALPFTRPAKIKNLINERRRGFSPRMRSFYALEIQSDGQNVFRAVWDFDERQPSIEHHADLWWEPEFFRMSKQVLKESVVDRKPLKREMRRLAATALQERGYRTEDVGGPGVAPGARLLARKGFARTQVAVRTSHDRKVGLTRTAKGVWRTIPKVEKVLVAAIASEAPNLAEIFCFDADVLIKAFNRQVRGNRALRKGSDGMPPPVFMALDPSETDPDDRRSNLKKHAEWSIRLPLKLRAPSVTPSGALQDLIARAVAEYAAIIGVDVADVTVDFRVTGRSK